MKKLILKFAIALLVTGKTITICAQDIPTDLQSLPVKILYMAYRPARWEEKALIEEVNEKRNLGGLVFVYYTNISDKPVGLREWYLNKREGSHFRISGDIAWDRRYSDVLEPGQTAVQEICGVSDDFQTGKNADFAIIGTNWDPIAFKPGVLEVEKLRVTSITMDSSLTSLCIHLRSFVPEETTIRSVTIERRKTEKLTLSSTRIESNGHIIALVKIDKAFAPGELALVKIVTETAGKEQVIYSHRNAFADYCPNGTWGIEPEQYEDATRHHLNTMVRNGRSDDAFFGCDYRLTGLKAMPHTGIYPNVDLIRDLENHPAVLCWYLQDEPDWSMTPQLVMASSEMTRRISVKKPSLVTLCRNVRFFEYAFIPDIPCHDHYSVTAPTTSKWPYEYGTHLEETGYYTADLKYASEPKPVWVWTQGVHLWEERPKMPLPTPDELGAQLYFNLGRGAKGNLWFTFMKEAGDRYPETKEALRHYSRLVSLLERDLLLSDPWHGNASAPEKIDVASLITSDKLIAIITNTNYQISDSSYQWTVARNVTVNLTLPDWFIPREGFEINPDSGIGIVKWKLQNNTLSFVLNELNMGKVLVFTVNRDCRKSYELAFDQILKTEIK